jgi:predicted DCC family thiol-disulfide oxidoreductase YuxK
VSDEGPIVLFDGVCNLCNGAVQFIVDHDRTQRLRFASLQSDKGRALLQAHGVPIPEGDPDTMIMLEGGIARSRSTAAVHIARHLTFPWRLAWVFVIIPAFLRDLVYRFVAANRYRVFGKSNECRVPTPELRARMVT